jgi:hypothetical protein
MPSFSISKLRWFWINWKIHKTTWAPVDSLIDRTALGLRQPPQIAAVADLPHPQFPAAVSLPPDSPPRRPPSTASTGYKGSPTPHEQPFFLPPVAPTASPCSTTVEPPCSATPGPPPSSPSPSCTTFPHRETSTIAPGRRPQRRSPPADHPPPWSNLLGEPLLPIAPELNSPCRRAALAPLPEPPPPVAGLPGLAATAAGSRGAIPFPCFPFRLVAQLKVGPATSGPEEQ